MRQRVQAVGVWVVILAVLGVGVLVWTGRLQLRWDSPWLGLEQLWADPAGEAKTLTPADTRGDGLEEPEDLAGNVVVPEEADALPSRTEVERMQVGAVGRLEVPSVKMDVPLNVMSPQGDVVTPPGFRAAYVLRGMGTGLQQPAGGRLIIAMHSAAHGFAPGNFLIDTESGKPVVSAGTEVVAAGHRYEIVKSEAIAKTELPSRADVWADEPGTLVLITCRQVGGPKTTENTVIWARLIA